MENESILALELIQLNPLIGKWNFKGSFKDNPEKWVEGWETYDVIDDGKAILCDHETQTILSGNIIDIYKNSMKISFKTDTKKIIGDNAWEINFVRRKLIFRNTRHRFTGILNESEGTIIGKWENMTTSGKWKYWYDKTFVKINHL